MNIKRLIAFFSIIFLVILTISINSYAQWSPYLGFNFYGNSLMAMAGINLLISAGINLLAIAQFELPVNFLIMSGLKKG